MTTREHLIQVGLNAFYGDPKKSIEESLGDVADAFLALAQSAVTQPQPKESPKEQEGEGQTEALSSDAGAKPQWVLDAEAEGWEVNLSHMVATGRVSADRLNGLEYAVAAVRALNRGWSLYPETDGCTPIEWRLDAAKGSEFVCVDETVPLEGALRAHPLPEGGR